MTGYSSLCSAASSLDAPGAPLGRQRAPIILNMGQASNGEEGNSIKKQDGTNLAILNQSYKADPSFGFPLCKVQANSGLSSGDVLSGRTSGCWQGSISSGVSDMDPVTVKYAHVHDMEPVITENARGNADLALSIVPFTEPVTTECDAEFAVSRTPYVNSALPVSRHPACPTVFSRGYPEQGTPDISMLNNPSRQPTTASFSPSSNIFRYLHGQCLAQPNDANQAPQNARLDNFVSHSTAITGECLAQPSTGYPASDNLRLDNIASHRRAATEQSFPAPLSTIGTKVGDKKQLTGLPLPDSLARSFDSSEMDKITKAIVRVNEFGSSLATSSAIKQGNLSASAQETGDGREVGSLKRVTPRVLPSVGAFTVQCAKCFKWRLVPSKELYEQIRQYILEKPFFCSTTSIWQPGASCDDPAELSEDEKFVWAIDKPNIPLAPCGWERLLVIRSEGCSKFADVYYVAPSGKKLRSMPDIERYLAEHPELEKAGVSLSQFSFVIPRALDENYCRKKTLGSSTVMRGSITDKSTPAYNLGVRSQPLKVPYVRKFPAEHLDHSRDFAVQRLECRHSASRQSSVNHPENTPLAVEPLRAWDPDNRAMMLSCHARVGLESSANAR